MIEISRNSHQSLSLSPAIDYNATGLDTHAHLQRFRMDFKLLAAILLSFAIAEASVIRDDGWDIHYLSSVFREVFLHPI